MSRGTSLNIDVTPSHYSGRVSETRVYFRRYYCGAYYAHTKADISKDLETIFKRIRYGPAEFLIDVIGRWVQTWASNV